MNLPTTKTRGASSNILQLAPTPSFHTISAFNLAAFFCLWPTWNLGVGCLKAAKSWRWIGKKYSAQLVCGFKYISFLGAWSLAGLHEKTIRICVPGNRCHGGKTNPALAIWIDTIFPTRNHPEKGPRASHLSPFFNLCYSPNSAQFVHRIMHTNPFAATWPRVKRSTSLQSGSSHLGTPKRLGFQVFNTIPFGRRWSLHILLPNWQMGKLRMCRILRNCMAEIKMRSESLLDWNLKLIVFLKEFLPKSSRVQVLCMWNVRRLFLWKFEGLALQLYHQGPFNTFL